MDTQTPPAQPVITSPINPISLTKSKQNGTALLIILLFVLAAIGTGLAYLFIPPNGTKKVTTAPITATPTPRENAKWQNYTNTKYNYSFAYPVTWKMTSTSPDQKDFELRYTAGSDLGIIKGSYFTANERSTLGQTYCDINTDQLRCHAYQLTTHSNVMIDRLTTAKTVSNKANALITLPNSDILQLEILDGNNDSYNTLTIMLDTLLFPGEKKVTGLQICPDAWPVNGTTFDYNGVKFPIEDVDKAWITSNCHYSP